MRCKTLTAAIAVTAVMLTAGCSTLERVVYHPDIDQGNYLTPTDPSKISKGMTKQQVAYLLGTPVLKDPYSNDKWIYVFRQQPGHEKVKQQTLTVSFTPGGTVSDVQFSPQLD